MTTPRLLPHDKLLDLLLDVVCVVDIDGRFLSVSAASERVFGFRPEEMVGRTAFELMHPEDLEATMALVQDINSGNPSHDHENRYIHKDGRIVHVMWTAQWFEAEQVRIGVARDITGRKRAEAIQAGLYSISQAAHTLKDLNELYAKIHEVIGTLLPADHFCIALYDAASGQLRFPYQVDQCNPPLSVQTLKTEGLIGKVIRTGQPLLLTPQTAEQPLNWLGVPLSVEGDTIGALIMQGCSGSVPYGEQDMELLQFTARQVADAIERKRTQLRLEYLAEYDQLTELPNRTLFLERLQNALERSQRANLRLAVMYLDLDNFKLVNDTYGHGMGDLLLREVAQRLSQCVRNSDTVGRLGGDEFAILLDSISQPEDAERIAEKVLEALSAPYYLESRSFSSGPSLGIAVYPDHGKDERQLVKVADEAMYAAKRSGGGRYCLAS